MEPGEPFILLLLSVFLIIFTLGRLDRFRDLRRIFLSKSKQNALDAFFGKYFEYYNQLPVKEKNRFVYRAYNLTNYIKIAGKQDFEITDKVKLFVVAAQVQLTFGFKYYVLPIFRKILIYPGAYKSPVTGKMHYGEVNPKGIIVLSWKRLVKGHLIPHDKINLGLHELAHALMHTIIYTNDHELGLNDYLRDIVRLSKIEIEKIKSDDHHFFRAYAATNIYEFFAIAVEYFFEVSKELKEELPQLYDFLVKLLKQDPYRGIYRLNNVRNEKRSYYRYQQRIR